MQAALGLLDFEDVRAGSRRIFECMAEMQIRFRGHSKGNTCDLVVHHVASDSVRCGTVDVDAPR